MDETISREPMALKFLNKINGILKVFHTKNSFLIPGPQRILSNALIQQHFDYACPAWYPYLNGKLQKTATNAVICFVYP